MTYNLTKLTLTDAHDSPEISLGKDKSQLKNFLCNQCLLPLTL